MKKIRLLIMEDNRLLRDGIIAMLKNQKDLKIFSTSGKDSSTVNEIRRLKPNLILLDLGLHSRKSLATVEIVKKDFPEAKVVIIDFTPLFGDINLLVKAGASGFILKDATLDDFLLTIRKVAGGANVVPPASKESLFSQIVEHALQGGKIKLKKAIRMTKREREVIRLISYGLSNNEIGHELHVSTFTVKSHVHNIMEKLTLHSRLEVANYSFSNIILKKVVKNISTIK